MKCGRYCLIYGLILLLLTSAIGFSIVQSRSNGDVFISTTTSVQNTGLLDILIEQFEQNHDLEVKYTAIGSGAAIQLARDGEVDAVLVHAPALEQDLIADGYADMRHTLWYNYFILVGSDADPANISGATTAVEAFERIFHAGEAGKATFYSRGDNSGTHLKELEIWDRSEYTPPTEGNGGWYFETDTGMSATLTTANNDPLSYVLTDLGTFATLQDSQSPLDKVKLFEQDDLLYNPYSYLIINGETTGTDLNTEGAELFLEFLQDPDTNDLVSNYRKSGMVLFTPIATEN